jgi:NAD(P)-dependent dehydrogenase (short-subunit alcohol dehydrogenase family)
MWQTTEIIDIHWPQAAVFDYLAHFDNIGEWDDTVISVRPVAAGAPAIGSRYRLHVGFGPQRVPMTYEIMKMAPPHELLLRGRGESFTATDKISLTTMSGVTRINYQVSLEFKRRPPVWATRLVQHLFLKNVRRAAKRLAQVFNGAAPLPSVTPAVRIIDGAIFPGMAGFTRLGYRLAADHRPFASARLWDRTVVITGATGGIGLAAAQKLRRLGARLIIVGRDPEKTAAVCRQLEDIPGRGAVEMAVADMSVLRDVRRLAAELGDRLPEIHVLINNAGALFNQREETVEGIEKSFAVNLLGPYALSRLLLPTLRRSRPARIINVASGGMYTQAIDMDDLESVKTPYNGPGAYARAKRGMAIVSREMGKTHTSEGVSVHCMHPGWVDTPGLRHALPGFYDRIGSWLRSPDEGADTIVWLSGAAEGEFTSGLFWRDRRPRLEYVFPGTREAPGVPSLLSSALDRYLEAD